MVLLPSEEMNGPEKWALLTAKAHGGVVEGFLVLLPSKAEPFGLDVSVVVGLVTCEERGLATCSRCSPKTHVC